MFLRGLAYDINELLSVDPEQNRFKHEVIIHICLAFWVISEAESRKHPVIVESRFAKALLTESCQGPDTVCEAFPNPSPDVRTLREFFRRVWILGS